MFSTNIIKSINYSFARRRTKASVKSLSRANINRYFQKSQQKFTKTQQQFCNRLNIPQPPKKLLFRLFKQRPQLFVPNTEQHKQIQQRITLLKQLSNKYELAKVMLEVMYKNQYILWKMMSDQQVKEICRAVQQDYGFTPEEIKTVFSNYFRTINPKTLVMLDQKIELFGDYLHLSKQQSVRLFVKHHFLIPASTDKIRQTILLLLSLRRSVPTINRDRIIKLLNEHAQVFVLGRHQILDLLSDTQVWDIIFENPILLNNFPNEVMPLKRKLFRYFRFTTEMGRLMLRKYPLVLLSSISSLQAKLIFIRDRLKLPINQKTLELLQYKFSDIRPRGELMVRAKQQFTIDNILEDYIKITDEQFASKINIPVSRLVQEKQRFPQTLEIDFRRRKIFKGAGIQQKITNIITDLRGQLAQGSTSQKVTATL